MDTDDRAIAGRIAQARDRIAAAATAAGRSPDAVELVAVSKTQGATALDAALAAGQRVFGENRVQEARDHWAARRADVGDLHLRLIGPLQTNKARPAVALFDVIETLDRARLVEALADAVQAEGRSPRLLVQVDLGREPQKAGVTADGVGPLIATARARGLTVEGLMVIPPVDHDPDPYFRELAALARGEGLDVLSMGMSGDFEAAIAHGATHVRLGTALFGARPRPA